MAKMDRKGGRRDAAGGALRKMRSAEKEHCPMTSISPPLPASTTESLGSKHHKEATRKRMSMISMEREIMWRINADSSLEGAED